MLTHTTASYTRLAKLSAIYDLAVTWPLILPITVGILFGLIGQLHGALGIAPPHLLDPHGMVFANFTGSVVIIWATARLLIKDLRLTRLDAVGRWLFSLAMLRAILNGASPVFYLMIVVELGFAVAQSLPMRK